MTSPTLRVRATALLAVLAFSCTSAAYAQHPGEEAEWHIGPRFGFSPATGVIGIEAQREHLGLAAGGFCYAAGGFGGGGCAPTAGVKYYFDETGDSWALGGFYWQWDESDDDGEFYGLSLEHRFRYRGGLELALGLGVGRLSGADGTDTVAMPTLDFGISF